MKKKKKTIFSWSTGKDAALAYYYLQQNNNFEVTHLLTTVNTHYNRVTMHGLRRELMEQQIMSIGLPFSTVELPLSPDMSEYEGLLDMELNRLRSMGYSHVAYGDIFLQDLREYREQALQKLSLKACFPIWEKNTTALIKEFLSLHFKAIVISINAKLLDPSFVGRIIDEQFLNDLPSNVDPCGENGEFHTFCFDGPIFSNPVAFTIGETIKREYTTTSDSDATEQEKKYDYLFCDLIPK